MGSLLSDEQLYAVISCMRNRFLIMTYVAEQGAGYVIDVVDGKTGAWTLDAYIKCIGTGWDN